MTLKEILKDKIRRLKEVPDEFLTRVEKSQKTIFEKLLAQVSKLEQSDGKFVLSEKNLTAIDSIIDDLKKVVYDSDYADAVASFAKEFNAQGKINESYFEKAFSDFKTVKIADTVLKQAKKEAVEALLAAPMDENFLRPAKKLLTTLVNSGADFVESVKTIREFAEGGDTVDGKLLQYSKQIAHDSFSFADRSYSNAVADELEGEWYFYTGGEVLDTRCFCHERNGKYYYYKQIEAWGRGEDLGECKSGDLWQGANRNTNEQTIFIYLGGHNCLHALQLVSIFAVPKDVIEEAVSKWGYEPTSFEREELGL